ncbi:MAG TPA: GNAT family N-acetyltransferase [Gemmatimonadaceae bacterium]
MDIPIRTADLPPGLHARLAALLRATGAFTEDEVGVAVGMYDEMCEHGARRPDPAAVAGGDDAPARDLRHPAADASPLSDYRFLGAFTPEDVLVGYACYGPTPSTDRTFDLYWIAVDPAAHGTGIGTLLLSEVERRLQGHHARLLVVETSSRSDYAQTRSFYGRRGYTEHARVRDFYAPGDDRIILTKRFQDSPRGAGSASP